MRRLSRRTATAVEEIRAAVGQRCSTSVSLREQHGRDESALPPAVPDAVVLVESTSDVLATINACLRHRVPVIPFGAGTSLEGHVLAPHGGIALNMTRMNRIIDVSADDMDAVVEAGVTRRQLEASLGREGLFFPVDPGADATLGGMAATGASGTTTVGYGTMRENVLGLEAVLADGTLISTGSRARKSSAGYDLTRLLVGSEGTLGVVTRLSLRLRGIPDAVSAATVQFTTTHDAVSTAVEVLQYGIHIARMEYVDAAAIRAMNAYSNLGMQEGPTVFFEFHGMQEVVRVHSEAVAEIARAHGAVSVELGLGREERDRLWEARHNAFFASIAMRPGCRSITTDVGVPISRLAECIESTRSDLETASFPATMVGHVGDGNFHVLMLIDPDNARELEEARRVNERLVARALRIGGTCTGEHGIGLGKRRFLRDEAGAAIEAMKAIKRALDPHGIMNPGKVL